eukprot:581535_1
MNMSPSVPVIIGLYLFTLSVSSQSILTVKDFIYYNSGTTSKSQIYELVQVGNVYNEGYQYKDDFLGSNEWQVQYPLTYLFERYQNGTIGTPSSGLRSSVFLGPIGQGGFEMRGDGRLTDFTIFNNAPNARPSTFAKKWDLNEAVFGFTFRDTSASISKIFQTSPLDDTMVPYAIDSLTYSGSYPASRLIGIDDDFTKMGIKSINLTAFSSFEPLNIDMSSIPAVVFWFDIDNTDNAQNISMDFFFNWPDIIDAGVFGAAKNSNGFIINKLLNVSDPLYYTAGNISFTAQECMNTNQCNSPLNGDTMSNEALYQNWLQFVDNSQPKPPTTAKSKSQSTTAPKVFGHYAWNTKGITIPAGSVYRFSAVLSWYFPYRTFNNNAQYLGHYYNNLYDSAQEVNDNIIKILPDVIQNIASWHQLWDVSMNSMFPDFLKDVYLNGPGYISRTSYLLEEDVNGTGIWRQSESFSCYQIDPPHIHQYRSLAYNLIFGDVLDRGTLKMYTNGAEVEGGMVAERFGGDCSVINGAMGQPTGAARGDDNSLYVLGMYSQFKWYADGPEFVRKRFPVVKSAIGWIINQSVPHGYGVPYRLVNTNDEHGIIGDINTYNSMIYIAALYAMQVMTEYYEPFNTDYIEYLADAVSYANGNVSKLLWQPNGDDGNGFYRSFWCANGQYPPYALQSDVLYGYLWALILDLDGYFANALDISTFTQHLQQELERNWSPFGLVFMTNHTTSGYNCGGTKQGLLGGFQDFDTWEKDVVDFAAISLFLDGDSVKQSLGIAQVGLDKYRELFKDQWDWRDTSSVYKDNDPEYSRPIVNSHYARQLIEYSMMLALNGQKFTVDPSSGNMTLEINPIVSLEGDDGCLPILLPQCTFVLCVRPSDGCVEIDGLFGQVTIDTLWITNKGTRNMFSAISIWKGGKCNLCMPSSCH